MLDELRQIDTSTIDELSRIKGEQEVLEERLRKMEDKRGAVTEAVFERVHGDYQRRHEGFEDEARPLKQKARAEYAKLGAMVRKVEEALEAARLEREELVFRQELGEFEQSDFETQLQACDARLQELEAEIAEAEELRRRFVAAFRSEDELSAAPSSEMPAPPPSVPPTPSVPPPPAEPASDDEPETSESTEILDGAIPPPPPVASTHPTELGATILLGPRLTELREEGDQDHTLGPATTVLGRGSDCTIRLVADDVAPRHAAVELNEQGFVLRDLGSKNGTSVNDQRIKEHVLRHGDTVRVGQARLLFREG